MRFFPKPHRRAPRETPNPSSEGHAPASRGLPLMSNVRLMKQGSILLLPALIFKSTHSPTKLAISRDERRPSRK